jgi:hypothetical protein
MKYQGGNRKEFVKDLAHRVFSLLEFSNDCHDPHSGEFCSVHNTIHPSAEAAASGGYGVDRFNREQEMKANGESYKPYGKSKPLRLTHHLSSRLKEIGLNVSNEQIEKLIREKTPVYIQHENSTKEGQNPVYHYDLPNLGFEIGFGIAKDGSVTTVIPTGYKLEAHGMEAYKAAGKPRPRPGTPNIRAEAKREEAKRLTDAFAKSKVKK